MMEPPLAIVGLDPGTTAAYALVSLNGEVIQTRSQKEFSLSLMLSEVFDRVTPILCATDKGKVPTFVADFGAKSGCVIVSPDNDLTKDEKRQLLKGIAIPEKIHTGNQHEDDALAAALFCFQRYRTRIEKTKRFISEKGLEEKKLLAMTLALREGFAFQNIEEMLRVDKEEQRVLEKVTLEQKITKKDFLLLLKRLAKLQQEQTQLKKALQERDERNRILEKQNKERARELEKPASGSGKLLDFKDKRLHDLAVQLEAQRKTLRGLNHKINSLYEFIERSVGLQLVKNLRRLAARDYQDLLKRGLHDGDYILVELLDSYSPTVLAEISKKEITLVFLEKSNILKKIPNTWILIDRGDLEKTTQFYCLIRKEVLEKRKKEQGLLLRVVDEYQKERSEQMRPARKP